MGSQNNHLFLDKRGWGYLSDARLVYCFSLLRVAAEIKSKLNENIENNVMR